MTAPQATLYPALFKGGWQDSENMEVVQKLQAGTSISFPGTYTSTAWALRDLLHAFPCSNTNTCSSKTKSQQNYFQGRTYGLRFSLIRII